MERACLAIEECTNRCSRPDDESSRDFASNVGLEFQTPEEYFLAGPIEAPNLRPFNPKQCVHSTIDITQDRDLANLLQDLGSIVCLYTPLMNPELKDWRKLLFLLGYVERRLGSDLCDRSVEQIFIGKSSHERTRNSMLTRCY